MSKKNKPQIPMTTETKCSFCVGSKCCSYITQEIETPRSKYDFEHLLWQISHKHISIYKDDDGWYLMVKTPCLHLQEDGGCGIYLRRPQICRDHSNDYCEYDEPAEGNFKHYFDSYASLRDYCKKRFKKWER